MLERRITFRCELLEDLHSGSGVGRLKTVDDCHARDVVGRPVVWYSMLAGLLRDAADDLRVLGHPLAIKDDDQDDRIQRLFGAEGQAARSALVCRSLHFDRPKPPAVGGTEGSPAAPSPAPDTASMFVNVTSTSREVHSRRPLDETLRTVEFAVAGLVAAGELRFRGDNDDEQLLKLCLQRLVALGGGRTRGAGRIQLSGLDSQSLPEQSAERLLQGPASLRVRLVLRNLEPLCLPSTAYPGNVLDTETWLPGQTLRGAFLTALRAGGLASDEDLERVAAGNGAQFTNGYFVPARFLRSGCGLSQLCSLPLPLTAQEAKATALPAGTGAVPWWAEQAGVRHRWLSDPSREQDTLWQTREAQSAADDVTSSFKRVKTEDYLVSLNGTTWYRERPAIATLMRNRTPVRRQDRAFDSRRLAATDDKDLEKADLFSEIVLAEDQCFVSDLVFGSVEAAEAFQRSAAPLLAAGEEQRAWLRVGRGGRPVRIERAEWLTDTLPAHRASPPAGKAHWFSLTLISDLITRAPDLSFRTTLDAKALVRLARLAGDEAARIADGIVVDTKASLAETRVVHGFNTAAGARRSPALAIRRGSAFVVKPVDGDFSAVVRLLDELSKREQAGLGLGERTEEGFGRFCLNHPAHNPLSGSADLSENKQGTRTTVGSDSEPVPPDARTKREQVIDKVLKTVENLRLKDAIEKDGRFPGRSQWQRLRHDVEAVAVEKEQEAKNGLAGIVGRLGKHAHTLGGRVWAYRCPAGKELHAEMTERLRHLDTAPQQRTFLIYLCRWVVAQLDRAADERRRKDRGEEKKG